MTTPSFQPELPFDAYVFDCDGTLCNIEGIDELARMAGVGPAVEALTHQAMTTTGLNAGLYEQRLNLIKPDFADIIKLGMAYCEHQVPDAKAVIQLLQRLNKPVYIISAGLYPAVVTFGNTLSVPESHVFAVNITFDAQGDYVDFDHHSALVTPKGKCAVVAALQQKHPRIFYVGDGLNDFDVYSLVARFVGYGGAFYREGLASKCEFYVTSASLSAILPLALTHSEQIELTASEQLLYQQGVNTRERHALLQAAAPFAELTAARLQQLAATLTELTLPADTILFHQGDPGDACYLIKSGRIEISLPTKVLATLESTDIFGESALLLDAPRNANARALETTTLLVLNKTIFLDLIQTEQDTANALLLLQHMRSRPTQLPSITINSCTKANGETEITLKNTITNKYFRLSSHGLFIWEQLDGMHSLSEITRAFYQQFNLFNPSLISTLMMALNHSGFIKLDNKNSPAIDSKKWRIQDVDSWLTRTYTCFIAPLFSQVGLILLFLIASSGLICFMQQFSAITNLMALSPHKWWLVLIAFGLTLATVIPHELAHAYATKHFGRQVHGFGIGWLWYGPVAFCDTSDMWLAPKWQRFAVDSAGICLNLILAGIAGCCLYVITQPDVLIIAGLFALMNYINVIANASPVFELDGYYMLMDALDKPNVRSESTYWVVTLFYILLLQILFPFFLATHLLHGLFNIGNTYVSFSIIVVIVAMSVWSLINAYRIDCQNRKRT